MSVRLPYHSISDRFHSRSSFLAGGLSCLFGDRFLPHF
ncbi:hypothetical protein RISK_006081 [Rhodopirellula islandica]|uniref:Uncharacterized protein n=1 Tax=Rhodopirellula islandica TaxID=595434 RepID=A0A0J1B5A8_RHOIS|nr:hypothetical protein RISK_006081 [Rhodopirellula islandica]